MKGDGYTEVIAIEEAVHRVAKNIVQLLADRSGVTETAVLNGRDARCTLLRRCAMHSLFVRGWKPKAIALWFDRHESSVYTAVNQLRDVERQHAEIENCSVYVPKPFYGAASYAAYSIDLLRAIDAEFPIPMREL